MSSNIISELRLSWFEEICKKLPSLILTDGWIKLWLIKHFENNARLENQDPNSPLRRYIWTPGPDTQIVIEDYSKWKPEMTERRPALIIKRNAWKVLKLGIGDKWLGHTDEKGNVFHEIAIQGSSTIFCISNTGAETEILADEVFRELVGFSQLVRKALNLLMLKVEDIGELVILDESRENFVIPITLNYAYDHKWIVSLANDAPIDTNFNFGP